MTKLCTPEVEATIQRLTDNIEQQRLLILKMEFYMYMEDKGYPNFWETCKGILYPTTAWNKDRKDKEMKWYFKFKDGEELSIPLDDDNRKFMELHDVKQ